jgi:alcohol dehydrogenase (NADP+)
MLKTQGYAAFDATSPVKPYSFERRDPGPEDILIDITHCGVCHSDLHQVRNEWGNSRFPMVPGHEIIGTVSAIGKNVNGFAIGETVGVGCLVDSCRTCPDCRDHQEQFCNAPVFTYNSADPKSGGNTYGGYSTRIVVDQHFVLHVPSRLDPAAAAPLLCAGITTYSPLRHWKIGKGAKVGIVGLGGLGHMGVKFARAMGAHVVLFTTSTNKVEDAKRLGAHEVVLSNNPAMMAQHALSFDFILNTVAVPHNLDSYTGLLKRDGTLCLVGVPDHPHPSPSVGNLIFKRRQIAGSLIGGIKETQEMLDFCAEHGIVSDIEIIPVQQINTAYERMLKSDVKYRFVIDIGSLKTEATL